MNVDFPNMKRYIYEHTSIFVVSLVVRNSMIGSMTDETFEALPEYVQDHYSKWLASKIVGGEYCDELLSPLFV